MIYKVTVEYKDMETLEEINKTTFHAAFNTENWCDKDDFERYGTLSKHTYPNTLQALRNGTIDYIIFKLEE